MHGPKASVSELATKLIPQEDGGVLSKTGCVDYSVGKGVSPGIFVIVKAKHPRIHERFADLKMGEGPYYAFHRPYHLTSLEVPLSAARAVLYGRQDMVPMVKPVAEVCAVAKKDLKIGEMLDSIGEYCYRSWTMTVEEAQANDAIPCGLLEKAIVKAPIQKGALLTLANVSIQSDSKIAVLRAKQDALISQL
jgi:predicted homoserine dehydrogenase-like protein